MVYGLWWRKQTSPADEYQQGLVTNIYLDAIEISTYRYTFIAMLF
ncbi:MAG: hypothetical protein ACJAT8_000490 [Cellvibrionaceae bacterium]|jgi:hypothetical protein